MTMMRLRSSSRCSTRLMVASSRLGAGRLGSSRWRRRSRASGSRDLSAWGSRRPGVRRLVGASARRGRTPRARSTPCGTHGCPCRPRCRYRAAAGAEDDQHDHEQQDELHRSGNRHLVANLLGPLSGAGLGVQHRLLHTTPQIPAARAAASRQSRTRERRAIPRETDTSPGAHAPRRPDRRAQVAALRADARHQECRAGHSARRRASSCGTVAPTTSPTRPSRHGRGRPSAPPCGAAVAVHRAAPGVGRRTGCWCGPARRRAGPGGPGTARWRLRRGTAKG